MNYNEAKFRQLAAAGSYRVYAHALEFESDAGDEGISRRHWRPVQLCWCVQDSPQNPCPCDRSIVWWLWEDAIIAKGDSGRKDHRGKELQFFDVRIDSTIMVESTQPVSAGALKAVGTNLTLDQLSDLIPWTGGNFAPGTMIARPLPQWVKDLLKFLAYEIAADLAKELIRPAEWKKDFPPPW